MNRWCSCKELAQSGNIEGIEFEVCVSCEKLSWEPTDTKNFVGLKIPLLVELVNPSKTRSTIEDLLSWVNEVLEDFDSSLGWKIYVDLANYYEEELAEPVTDGACANIEIVLGSWNLDLIDDGEEAYGHGRFMRSELAKQSTDDLVRGTISNIWDHMADYQSHALVKLLIEHIESQRFRSSEKPTSQANLGLKVNASLFDSEELIWSLDEQPWW